MTIAATNTMVRSIVPKSCADTYKRFARLTGKSTSAVLAEFLIEAEPQVRRLASMLEVAKKQRSLFPAATIAELEAAIDEMSGNATDVVDRVQKALQLPLEKPKATKSTARVSGASVATAGPSRRRRRA